MSPQNTMPDSALGILKNQVANLEHRVEEDRMIFDQLPIMFWYKDGHNMHLRVNRPAAALEGLPITAIEGKNAEELYPKEQAERFLREDLQVIASNQPKLGFIEQHISPMGKSVWLKTGKLPTHDDQGNANGVIAFALDVTEEYELRALLSATLKEVISKLEGGANAQAILPRLKEMLEKVDAKG
jgi:PAS domain S-box-containing protein